MKFRIHRLAAEEIAREVIYYESQRSGLGAELRDAIKATLTLIRRFPKAAPQWKAQPDRRVALLDRFSFTVPYQLGRDEILILALAHTSRRAWLLVEAPLVSALTSRSLLRRRR